VNGVADNRDMPLDGVTDRVTDMTDMPVDRVAVMFDIPMDGVTDLETVMVSIIELPGSDGSIVIPSSSRIP